MAEHAPLADEPVELPVVGSAVEFAGRIWDVRRDTVEYRGGRLVRDYIDHPGAVAVLALDDDDRVLLIQQYRHPVRSRDWEIPAGLLDVDGEHALEAAQRELAEEADIAASDWSVLVDYRTTPGGSNEAIRIFLARGLTPTAVPHPRQDEEADMAIRWVPLDECVDAVLARRVQNPSLVVSVLAAHAARARGWSTLAPADADWPTHPKLRPAAS